MPELSKAALSIFGAITVAGLMGTLSEPEQTTEFIEQTTAAVCDLLFEGLRSRP